MSTRARYRARAATPDPRRCAVEAIERIPVLRDIGITQIGLLVDFGSLAQGVSSCCLRRETVDGCCRITQLRSSGFSRAWKRHRRLVTWTCRVFGCIRSKAI